MTTDQGTIRPATEDARRQQLAAHAEQKRLQELVDAERIRRQAKRRIDQEERGTTNPPEILSLRARLARPRTETRWRIIGFQAIGHRVLMAAQFKAGKTTLAANVARSVLDGDPFLDAYETAAIDGVLALLDFEMSAAQLDDWYRAQGIRNDDRLVIVPMRGAASSFNIVDPDVRAEWVALFKAHNVKYLILDCLRPVLDALGLNEHTEAGLFLTALDALLRDAEVPEALVVQHMGHKGERARGDSRLLDWPDVGWTLVRDGEDDPASTRYIKAFGRDVDVPETELAYDIATRRLSVAEDAGSRADARQRAVLADLVRLVEQAAQPPSGRQIEEALKGTHTQHAIRLSLKQAVADGVLTKTDGRTGGFVYHVAVAAIPPGLLDGMAL